MPASPCRRSSAHPTALPELSTHQVWCFRTNPAGAATSSITSRRSRRARSRTDAWPLIVNCTRVSTGAPTGRPGLHTGPQQACSSLACAGDFPSPRPLLRQRGPRGWTGATPAGCWRARCATLCSTRAPRVAVMGGQASAATGPAIAAVTATTPSASLRRWQVSQLRASGARSGDSILEQGRGRAWARRQDSARSSESRTCKPGGGWPASSVVHGRGLEGGSRAGAQCGELREKENLGGQSWSVPDRVPLGSRKHFARVLLLPFPELRCPVPLQTRCLGQSVTRSRSQARCSSCPGD